MRVLHPADSRGLDAECPAQAVQQAPEAEFEQGIQVEIEVECGEPRDVREAAVGGERRDRLHVRVHPLVRGQAALGLGLDESVALWERGEALARRCEEQLAGARERVQRVLGEAATSD